jgi:hypothetical protein
MGLAKDLMMQEDEQGWSFTTQHVCADCVDDDSLETVIRTHADATQACDFCSSSPAAPLDVLLEAFVNGLRLEYGDADNEGVAYESREGGYQWWGPMWNTWDLVGEFDHVLTGEGLLDAVRSAMHDRVWVEVNFAHPRRDEALSASWERFCEAVQYETRYVFWLRDDEDEEQIRSWGEIPASRILDDLGKLIEQLDLVRDLPAGSRWWRARTHSAPDADWGASELGTTPRENAIQANRMSPAGIPMFYGAVDPDTAVREVAIRTDDRWVTVAAFETSQACTVVDFTALPPVPSQFDPERAHSLRSLLFLHEFAAKLAQPARARLEQVDYVPTQVVTEYLLRIHGRRTPINGLLYPSAFSGGACAVLDVPNVRCAEQTAGWASTDQLRLGLVPGSAVTRRAPATSYS